MGDCRLDRLPRETQWREVAAWPRWRQRPPVMHPIPRALGRSGVLPAGERQEVQGAGGNPSSMVLLQRWHSQRVVREGGMGRAMVKGWRARVVSSRSNGDLLLFGSQGGKALIDFGQGRDSLKPRTDLKQRRDWGGDGQALTTGPQACSVHELQFCFSFRFPGQGGAHGQELASVQQFPGRLYPNPSASWCSVASPSCPGLCGSNTVPSAALQMCSGFPSFLTSFSIPPSPSAAVIPPPPTLHPSLFTTHLLPSARSSPGRGVRRPLPARPARLPVDLGRPCCVLVPSA